MRTKFPRLFAAVLLGLAAASLSFASGKVLILDYHSFLGTSSSLDWKLEDFASQIDKMRALGYSLVSLTDAMEGRIEGDRNIALTIDDGNHSIWQAAEEVLIPKAVPTELFIYPAVIGHEPHFLTREQLRSLAARGFAIGAHGYHHVPMSAIAWKRDPKTVAGEAGKPAGLLDDILGFRPLYFAYPYGVAGEDSERLVREGGYSWAFLAGDKFTFVDPSDPALDHWAVPRTIVYRWNRAALFRFLAKQAGVSAASPSPALQAPGPSIPAPAKPNLP